jgi:hypothetical protein
MTELKSSSGSGRTHIVTHEAKLDKTSDRHSGGRKFTGIVSAISR